MFAQKAPAFGFKLTKVVVVHGLVGPQHREVKLLDVQIVVAADFDQGADEGTQFDRRAGHQLQKITGLQPKHSERQLAQNVGVEQLGNGLQRFAQLQRHQRVIIRIERFGQRKHLLDFRVLLSLLDLVDVRRRQTGAGGQVVGRQTAFVPELLQLQAK